MPRLPIRNQRVPARDRRRAVPPPKKAEVFYGSSEWKDLRERLRKERGGRCETCGATGRVILHHKRERKDGGAALDPRNLIFQCDPCHGRVTAENRALRADEVDQDRTYEQPEAPPVQPVTRGIRLG